MAETLFNKINSTITILSKFILPRTFERISSVLENKKSKIAYHEYFSS